MTVDDAFLATFGNDKYLCKVRYGYGKPGNPHIWKVLNRGDGNYRQILGQMATHRAELGAIGKERTPETPAHEPHWNNDFFSGLDAASLYTLLATVKPRMYFEVGSGNSTLFAHRAIRDHGLNTQIVSLDPEPRAEIDAICSRCIRSRLEDYPPHVFGMMNSGDILFVDNSHRCLQNSDVTAFFLDVLPTLKKGVVVGLHDIFLPDDYPPGWEGRLYSEQYMLAAWLLGGGAADVIFPAYYVGTQPQFAGEVAAVFDHPGLVDVPRGGGIFWMIMR